MNSEFKTTNYPTLTATELKEYFQGYDFHELYDSSKEYQKDKFTQDFGKGLHQYIYALHKIQDRESKEETQYVVAEEELDEGELKMLAPYCQCMYHRKAWYNPRRMFICQCCVGCLQSDFPQQSVINRTREDMEYNTRIPDQEIINNTVESVVDWSLRS